MMAVTSLNTENFDSTVSGSDKPVLVDFWASWCGPCRMLSPIVDEIGNESDGRYKVCKVNVDEAPDLAERFSVMSIPTLMVFKAGEVADSSVGLCSKQDILRMLES